MRKKGVISVIVPVYKVEKYIEECVESIIGQTYGELEIILVDDGSPDRCGEICDRYAQADDRILVLHQKNGGAASAKNAALRAATGEYVTFVDGDDYLERDACEQLVKAMEDTGADVVQGGLRNVYVNAEHAKHADGEPRTFTTVEYLTLFTRDWTCAICCDKLFRRHVLTDVFFEEGHLIDDEFFTYKAIMNSRQVAYIPTITYNYRQRGSSVMNRTATQERKCLDTLDAVKKRREDVCARFPELKDHYEQHYAVYLLYLAVSENTSINTIREIRKRLRSYLADGKLLPWKKGRRKLFLRVLAFLAAPAEKTYRKRNEREENGGYELFE